MNEYQLGIAQFALLAQSIGIGFLIGLERERHPNKVAGVRTFTLIALAGSMSGYIASVTGDHYVAWVLIALVVASLLVAQYKSQADEPDTTTVLAAVLAFVLGFALWLGHTFLPAALAIVVTAVLYFREELRGVSQRLSRQDVTSFFQFSALAFILLPILPNRTYGPYEVVNPHQVGWLVVLISGLSLLGYVALRLLRGRSGLIVVGLLGGLVSTTATTLVFARHSKNISNFADRATIVILLSHLVMFVRIAVVVAVVEVALLKPMIAWIIGGLITGSIYLMVLIQRKRGSSQEIPELNVNNPTEIKTALSFALAFTLVLLLSAWMNDHFQNTGGYVVAFVSGLTDVDAITVANLKLFSVASIDSQTAVNSVVIAFIANLIFKFGIVVGVADRKLWAPVALGFIVLLGGVAAGVAF